MDCPIVILPDPVALITTYGFSAGEVNYKGSHHDLCCQYLGRFNSPLLTLPPLPRSKVDRAVWVCRKIIGAVQGRGYSNSRSAGRYSSFVAVSKTQGSVAQNSKAGTRRSSHALAFWLQTRIDYQSPPRHSGGQNNQKKSEFLDGCRISKIALGLQEYDRRNAEYRNQQGFMVGKSGCVSLLDRLPDWRCPGDSTSGYGSETPNGSAQCRSIENRYGANFKFAPASPHGHVENFKPDQLPNLALSLRPALDLGAVQTAVKQSWIAKRPDLHVSKDTPNHLHSLRQIRLQGHSFSATRSQDGYVPILFGRFSTRKYSSGKCSASNLSRAPGEPLMGLVARIMHFAWLVFIGGFLFHSHHVTLEK